MLKGYFDTIPYDLEEAGRVDGLGVFGSFWRIVMPLSIPGLAVTAFYSLRHGLERVPLRASASSPAGTR